MNGAPSSDPRNDVGHEVSVDPVDDPRVDISERSELEPLEPRLLSGVRALN